MPFFLFLIDWIASLITRKNLAIFAGSDVARNDKFPSGQRGGAQRRGVVFVIPRLDRGIQVIMLCALRTLLYTWVPGSSPGMTELNKESQMSLFSPCTKWAISLKY